MGENMGMGLGLPVSDAGLGFGGTVCALKWAWMTADRQGGWKRGRERWWGMIRGATGGVTRGMYSTSRLCITMRKEATAQYCRNAQAGPMSDLLIITKFTYLHLHGCLYSPRQLITYLSI
jgi:hypothetical protein